MFLYLSNSLEAACRAFMGLHQILWIYYGFEVSVFMGFQSVQSERVGLFLAPPLSTRENILLYLLLSLGSRFNRNWKEQEQREEKLQSGYIMWKGENLFSIKGKKSSNGKKDKQNSLQNQDLISKYTKLKDTLLSRKMCWIRMCYITLFP